MTQSPDDKDENHETESAIPFETSLAELEQIVTAIDDGSLGLEESLSQFEKAIRLLRNCYRVLEQSEQRVNVLLGFNEAGDPVATPFDATATIDANTKTDANAKADANAKTSTASPTAGRRKKRTKEAPPADSDESTLF